jgi:hypothetical protein
MRTLLSTCALLAGCTGMTLGENRPGQDTHLDPPGCFEEGCESHTVGGLAVQPDEKGVWFVHRSQADGADRAHLTHVDPVTGKATDVLDVTSGTDRRIVFPSDDRALLMAQRDGKERLVLLDTVARKPIAWTTKPTWYWGTRRASSGRFLAVADNAASTAPLHVVDTRTLEHVVVPHGGTAIEAMWNHSEDRLLAVSSTNPFEPEAAVRLLRWQVSSIEDWPDADIDISLAGYGWDFFFSFTWIGISPDDRYAVFPLRRAETGEHVLAVLDQSDGSLRTVPGRGPVGFTPDSSTIVSYGYDEEQFGVLHLIDVVTLAIDEVPVPIQGGLSYFVTWDGNYVVATSVFGNDRLVIYDPETGESTQVDGPHVDLQEFVTRPGHHELWLASRSALHRLDLEAAVLEPIPQAGEVSRVNILPIRDQLVLASGRVGAVGFFDLASRAVTRTVSLDPPHERPIAASLDDPG